MITEEEYLNTIKTAKENGVDYIWSGELRTTYLRKCLSYAIKNNLVKITPVEMEQETGYDVEWM